MPPALLTGSPTKVKFRCLDIGGAASVVKWCTVGPEGSSPEAGVLAPPRVLLARVGIKCTNNYPRAP